MMQKILILDFGAQYSRLIAQRVRECNVYCEVKPHTISAEEVRQIAPIGIIFSGGPRSVYDATAPKIDPELLMPEAQRVFPDPHDPEHIQNLIAELGGVDIAFGGIGIISSCVTELAPRRMEVPTQSFPVSPPPMTSTFLPFASS